MKREMKDFLKKQLEVKYTISEMKKFMNGLKRLDTEEKSIHMHITIIISQIEWIREKKFKALREKRHITYWQAKLGMITDFSYETMLAR